MPNDNEPHKRKLSELKKLKKARFEARRKEYWDNRKELENKLGLEGYEQYERREIIRYMLDSDTVPLKYIFSDEELDELIDIYFPPEKESL